MGRYLISQSWPKYLQYFFSVLGIVWLLAQIYDAQAADKLNIPMWAYLATSGFLSFLWLIVDGYFISGFLKTSINIRSNGFDTKIIVKFGDLFTQDGWKAIPVNDFFDSIVDEEIISSNSIHGDMLKKYWAGNVPDWDQQVEKELTSVPSSTETRTKGKVQRFSVGTTAVTKQGSEQFICVVLSKTDISNNQVKADSCDLHFAVTAMLEKARTVCGNQPISIPLMGSGLARTGIKTNILIDLILVAIFEEIKRNKVTDEIRIILPKHKVSEINLANLKTDWS